MKKIFDVAEWRKMHETGCFFTRVEGMIGELTRLMIDEQDIETALRYQGGIRALEQVMLLPDEIIQDVAIDIELGIGEDAEE